MLQTTLNSEPTEDNLASTKSYVDYLSANERNRCDLSFVYNDQDNEFDVSNITNSDNITYKQKPCSDEEVSIKNYVDAELKKSTILIFVQKLQNYLRFPF